MHTASRRRTRSGARAAILPVVSFCVAWLLWPGDTWAGSTRDVDADLRSLRTAADADGPTAPTARIEYLVALYSLGRAEEAVRGWRQWVAEDPTALSHVPRLYWFSLALMETEHTGEAAVLLEEARTAGFLDSERSYWHGMTKELLCSAYLELAEFEQARELSSEIVRHGFSPEVRVLALYDLARAHEELGDSLLAREVWDLIESTAPLTPEAVCARERLRGARGASNAPGIVSSQPSGASASEYCLHLGTCRDQTTALAWVEAAGYAGVEAVIREDPFPDGTLFTVLGVGFQTPDEVFAARQRLALAGYCGVVAVRCRVHDRGLP